MSFLRNVGIRMSLKQYGIIHTVTGEYDSSGYDSSVKSSELRMRSSPHLVNHFASTKLRLRVVIGVRFH
jgi:hypothetical protein